MNTVYQRYRSDPKFRAALLRAAHRQRNAAIASFLSAAAAYFSPNKKHHAAAESVAA
jgi:hypothetical protein